MRLIDIPPVTPPPPRPASTGFPWGRYAPWGAVAALVLAFGSYVAWDRHEAKPGPAPTPPAPVVDFDPAFVPVGKQLRDRLNRGFAKGYEDGTKVFEAGQSRSMMIETGKNAETEERVKAYEDVAVSALNKVIDPDKAEDKITPEERRALVRARRGISRGMMP
jgi:ribosome modulation factor